MTKTEMTKGYREDEYKFISVLRLFQLIRSIPLHVVERIVYPDCTSITHFCIIQESIQYSEEYAEEWKLSKDSAASQLTKVIGILPWFSFMIIIYEGIVRLVRSLLLILLLQWQLILHITLDDGLVRFELPLCFFHSWTCILSTPDAGPCMKWRYCGHLSKIRHYDLAIYCNDIVLIDKSCWSRHLYCNLCFNRSFSGNSLYANARNTKFLTRDFSIYVNK